MTEPTTTPSGPRLESLCIYNPDLDPEGDELAQQIVFYYGSGSLDDQLRYIGIAQGLVELSREFANGQPVSSVDSSHSRMVIHRIEEPNWWVVANYGLGTGHGRTTKEDDTHALLLHSGTKDTRNSVARAEMLRAEIIAAYRRWRLHYGTLTMVMDSSSRAQFADSLKPWWFAWCHNWTAQPTDINTILESDHARMARGVLSSPTTDAVRSVTGDKGLLQVIITRHQSSPLPKEETPSKSEPPSSIPSSASSPRSSVHSSPPPSIAAAAAAENKPPASPGDIPLVDYDGLVYTSRPVISQASVCDIVNWIRECDACRSDAVFLEPSGFVAHLNRSSAYLAATASPSSFSMDSITSSLTVPLANLSSIFPSMPSISTMGNSAVGSVSHLIDMMSLKPSPSPSPSPAPEAKSKPKPKLKPKKKNDFRDVTPSDELSDSRFLVGLQGDLEETDDEPEIESKTIYVQLEDSPGKPYEKCQLVIYRRRPLVFTLVYRDDASNDLLYAGPGTGENYSTLHRRLAALTEPILADLGTGDPIQPPNFYYLFKDDRDDKLQMQSSLPPIPSLPPASQLESLDASLLEKLFLARAEFVHIHQVMMSLLEDAKIDESERFVSTARGFWVYWTRLSDGREAILARKRSKRTSETTGLLGQLGKEARLWLENYKYYGKV